MNPTDADDPLSSPVAPPAGQQLLNGLAEHFLQTLMVLQ